MEAVRRAQKKYCSSAMILVLGVSTVLLLFGMRSVGKGLILGTLFSIFNFVVMAETLPRSVVGTRRVMTLRSLVSVLLRYALLAVPLFLSLKYEAYHLAGVVPGLFAVQLVILADHLVVGRLLSPKQGRS